MRYHWLAHHLVQDWFPELNPHTRAQLVSEAVCRAWCSFTALDYRLMRSCVFAAAQRKGLLPPACISPASIQDPGIVTKKSELSRRAAVIQIAEYRLHSSSRT